MVKDEKKSCYNCKERKLKSEMTLLGVWVCNKCIKAKSK